MSPGKAPSWAHLRARSNVSRSFSHLPYYIIDLCIILFFLWPKPNESNPEAESSLCLSLSLPASTNKEENPVKKLVC